MSRNGSGTYTLPAGNPVVSNTVIDPVWANNSLTDIATALTRSVAYDGQTIPVADMTNGGFRLKALGAGVLTTDAANMLQLQNGTATWCGNATGTADALIISPTPAITALVAGQRFAFKATATNATATPTLGISAMTPFVLQSGGVAVAAGDIVSGKWYEVLYDGALGQLRKFAIASGSGGGATGGGTDKVFQESQQTVTTSYTFTTGYSAMSIGPITINGGAVVTIPSGKRWVVL